MMGINAKTLPGILLCAILAIPCWLLGQHFHFYRQSNLRYYPRYYYWFFIHILETRKNGRRHWIYV